MCNNSFTTVYLPQVTDIFIGASLALVLDIKIWNCLYKTNSLTFYWKHLLFTFTCCIFLNHFATVKTQDNISKHSNWAERLKLLQRP